MDRLLGLGHLRILEDHEVAGGAHRVDRVDQDRDSAVISSGRPPGPRWPAAASSRWRTSWSPRPSPPRWRSRSRCPARPTVSIASVASQYSVGIAGAALVVVPPPPPPAAAGDAGAAVSVLRAATGGRQRDRDRSPAAVALQVRFMQGCSLSGTSSGALLSASIEPRTAVAVVSRGLLIFGEPAGAAPPAAPRRAGAGTDVGSDTTVTSLATARRTVAGTASTGMPSRPATSWSLKPARTARSAARCRSGRRPSGRRCRRGVPPWDHRTRDAATASSAGGYAIRASSVRAAVADRIRRAARGRAAPRAAPGRSRRAWRRPGTGGC